LSLIFLSPGGGEMKVRGLRCHREKRLLRCGDLPQKHYTYTLREIIFSLSFISVYLFLNQCLLGTVPEGDLWFHFALQFARNHSKQNLKQRGNSS